MDTFLTCTMVFLMLLASFNLFVGVSNDAVNFLGSALGSKSARYNIVMGVAAAGVLLGCTFSSGMMEIARSGIFNPQLFTYWDVMLIFFAVMLTDVLLLDTFNSLGLPTSTTVSIVFELLGASVVSAAYKLWVSTGTIVGLGAYINNEKALSDHHRYLGLGSDRFHLRNNHSMADPLPFHVPLSESLSLRRRRLLRPLPDGNFLLPDRQGGKGRIFHDAGIDCLAGC